MPPVTSSSYWIPPSRRLSVMHSTGTSSTSRSSTSAPSDTLPRNYIDPWDLENYAYLRRHCPDLDPMDSDPVISLSTNGLDSAHSDFYFVPARQPLTPLPQPPRGVMVRGLRRPSLMVVPQEDSGLEEEDFYNARCEVRTPCCHQRPSRRHSAAPFHPSYTPPHPQQCLEEHLVSFHPGLCEKTKARQLTSAEEPPPLVYVYQTPRLNRKSSRQIRELIPPMTTSSEENDELYDELVSMARRRKYQQHQHAQQFGLSTFTGLTSNPSHCSRELIPPMTTSSEENDELYDELVSMARRRKYQQHQHAQQFGLSTFTGLTSNPSHCSRELIPPMTTSSEENDELYDELVSMARRRKYQQHQHAQQFGLSTFTGLTSNPSHCSRELIPPMTTSSEENDELYDELVSMARRRKYQQHQHAQQFGLSTFTGLTSNPSHCSRELIPPMTTSSEENDELYDELVSMARRRKYQQHQHAQQFGLSTFTGLTSNPSHCSRELIPPMTTSSEENDELYDELVSMARRRKYQQHQHAQQFGLSTFTGLTSNPSHCSRELIPPMTTSSEENDELYDELVSMARRRKYQQHQHAQQFGLSTFTGLTSNPSHCSRELIPPMTTSSEENDELYDELVSMARRRKYQQHQHAQQFGLSTFTGLTSNPSHCSRELIPPMTTSSEENDELYDELVSMARRRKYQQHQHAQQFGLSTFGHLKIDYSCNWNNLDRYIAHT